VTPGDVALTERLQGDRKGCDKAARDTDHVLGCPLGNGQQRRHFCPERTLTQHRRVKGCSVARRIVAKRCCRAASGPSFTARAMRQFQSNRPRRGKLVDLAIEPCDDIQHVVRPRGMRVGSVILRFESGAGCHGLIAPRAPDILIGYPQQNGPEPENFQNFF
jgi:hypothetical protein